MTRSHVAYERPDGSRVLFCDGAAIAAFDLFILRREKARADYSDSEIQAAESFLAGLDEAGKDALANAILLGLPGTVENFTIEDFLEELKRYDGISRKDLRNNLFSFLTEIIPVAEEIGIRMAIHPDDPPRNIFGLPRIMSTASDVEKLIESIDSPNSGLTLCTGSFGGRRDNNLVEMFNKFAERIHFAHLRNVTHIGELPGSFFESNHLDSFYESDHLEGNVDMYEVMKALLQEQKRRSKTGRADALIPIRPDHGRELIEDIGRGHYAGYSYTGRLVGLAELRGLELGIRKSLEMD